MKKRILLLSLLVSMGSQIVSAQTRTVKGRVVDENGEAIPGATVTVKGTTSGTLTDMDGNYTLEVPEDKSIIVIESMGAEKSEITVSNDGNLVTTQLGKSSTQSIDQVSVYGRSLD